VKLQTIITRGFRRCRHCGRITLHEHERALLPEDPTIFERFAVWLHNFTHQMECLERDPLLSARPKNPGPIEPADLDRLVSSALPFPQKGHES
jgi:hypothetical protein